MPPRYQFAAFGACTAWCHWPARSSPLRSSRALPEGLQSYGASAASARWPLHPASGGHSVPSLSPAPQPSPRSSELGPVRQSWSPGSRHQHSRPPQLHADESPQTSPPGGGSRHQESFEEPHRPCDVSPCYFCSFHEFLPAAGSNRRVLHALLHVSFPKPRLPKLVSPGCPFRCSACAPPCAGEDERRAPIPLSWSRRAALPAPAALGLAPRFSPRSHARQPRACFPPFRESAYGHARQSLWHLPLALCQPGPGGGAPPQLPSGPLSACSL
mmetsp:Transcript_11036/g.20611  ORF Transcript_11036/g.20611 Transcript_11036/m.20611 type:complete len:271 (-) Transcript_11036:248-1060(-)